MFGRLFSTRDDKKPDIDEPSARITKELDRSDIDGADIDVTVNEAIRPFPEAVTGIPKIRVIKELFPVKENLPDDYKIGDLFKAMVDMKASELYISSESPPYFSVNGRTVKTDLDVLQEDRCRELLCQVCSEEELEDLEASGEIEFTFEVKDLSRFRINIFKQVNGLGGIFKKLPFHIRGYKNLNLPPIVSKIALYNRGIVIVTGPSCSGKSSTMASIIDLINKSRDALIMTVEKPVEFIHNNKKSIVINREIGTNVFSYKEALQAVLKEDPDVVFLGGELDSAEIAELALKTAEMGTLVFCCMHLNGSCKAIKRFLDFFPEKQKPLIAGRLAINLKAILAQQLAPDIENSGLCLATEIMLNSAEVAGLIRTGQLDKLNSVIDKSRHMGMHTMGTSARELFDQEAISLEIALELGCDPAYLYPTGELNSENVK